MSLSGSSHHLAYSRAGTAPLLHVQWEELSRLLDRQDFRGSAADPCLEFGSHDFSLKVPPLGFPSSGLE